MNVAFIYMNNHGNVGRGAGYVAASVIRAGYKLSFFDTLYTPVEIAAQIIIRGKFDILMISNMTMMFPEALRLINIVKY